MVPILHERAELLKVFVKKLIIIIRWKTFCDN